MLERLGHGNSEGLHQCSDFVRIARRRLCVPLTSEFRQTLLRGCGARTGRAQPVGLDDAVAATAERAVVQHLPGRGADGHEARSGLQLAEPRAMEEIVGVRVPEHIRVIGAERFRFRRVADRRRASARSLYVWERRSSADWSSSQFPSSSRCGHSEVGLGLKAR